MRSNCAGVVVGSLFILAFNAPLLAQLEFQRVALTGEAAPGAGTGVTFSEFVAATINNSNQIALEARTRSASGVVSGGIWRGAVGNSFDLLARAGAAAPGGGTYTAFSIGSPPTGIAVINDQGAIAFGGWVSGAAPITRNSIWVYRPGIGALPGTVSLQIYAGMQQPGTSASPRYLNGFSEYRFNNAGTLSFASSLATTTEWWTQGSVGPSAMFTSSPEVLTAVAQVGATVGGKTLASITTNSSSGGHWLSDADEVAFSADLVSGTVHSDGFVRASSSAAPTPVVAIGDAVPGLPGAFIFNSLQAKKMNANGDALLIGNSSDPSLGKNDSALWVKSASGVLSRLIGVNDTVPNSGGFVVRSFPQNPNLTDGGRAVVKVWDNLATEALLFGPPGDLKMIARQGDPAPGVPGFSYYNSFDARASDSGAIAFRGFTSPPISSFYQEALWLTNPQGVTQLITRPGMQFDVDTGPGSDLRTVAHAYFGSTTGRTFTDDGLLLIALSFTDGSSGLFTAAATPEPAATLLLPFLVPMLVRRCRRPRTFTL